MFHCDYKLHVHVKSDISFVFDILRCYPAFNYMQGAYMATEHLRAIKRKHKICYPSEINPPIQNEST